MTVANESRIAAPISFIFRTNEGLFHRSLEGLSAEQLWQKSSGNNTPMLWIAAHIVQTRTSILKIIRESFDTGWEKLFSRGATVQDSSIYPGVDEVVQKMKDVTAQLHGRLQAMDNDEISKPVEKARFAGAETLADEIAFLAFHESYHIGQMAFIRKSFGFTGLVG
jgi:uncharacterized damage-inducible protein DinB